jgi:hypothetical protein
VEDVARRIAEGDHEGAARQFVDLVLGPGAWESELPPEIRAIYVPNAPTFLDDLRDPTFVTIDETALARLEIRVCLTQGLESPPLFARAIDRLVELIPRARRETIEGAATCQSCRRRSATSRSRRAPCSRRRREAGRFAARGRTS